MTFLTLLGCYDFQGDEGALWFSSDLVVDYGTPWTPDHAVAGGTAPLLAATGRVGDEDADDAPVVWGWSSRGEQPDEENALRLDGLVRGTTHVEFDGELFDQFDVRFRPAQSVMLVDGTGHAISELVVAPDTEARLAVRVTDRWGRPLGWKADSLAVEADGPASAWAVDGSLFVEASQAAGVFLDAAGVEAFVAVDVAPAAQVEVRPVAEVDGHCIVEHVAWTVDGRRVWGVPAEFGVGWSPLGRDLAVSDEPGHPGCE